MNIPLSGADRVFNADNMFSSDGRFFLVEFKSSRGDLRSEDRKKSACVLCEGLFTYWEALDLHQQCHFAAWGKKRYNGGLDTFFGVYEDLVCRPETLPSCGAVRQNPPHRHLEYDGPAEVSGEQLAIAVATGQSGLERHDFLRYLNWLLWAREETGSYEKTRAMPITLFGTSFAGGIKSREFANFQQLDAWAEPFIAKYMAAVNPSAASDPPSEPSSDTKPGGYGPKN
ncbi:hypothetical protein IYR97_20015 [Pseudomonas fulva]|uniref:C2H2-type domain-containing protein n=1 Tax=Pseudomonas fulva TaxID=47880 RepID=A0A7S9LGH5_9PSED|nr:hypothetical protein [Pseudomonas fulva]QPH43549.1 hypothetical protein IYR97_20015 [Pseudomonas fulva]QPH48628.1 hypothetical protein IZU98_19980 [Pseudomonas fulva]